MQRNPKSVMRALGCLVILLAIGAWMYYGATNRATHGDFPLYETGLVVAIVLTSFAPAKLFPSFRRDPFRIVGVTAAESEQRAETKREKTENERLTWFLASWLGLFVLELIADQSAGAASRDPSRQHLLSYAAWATAFIVYMYIWILAFPILEFRDAILEG